MGFMVGCQVSYLPAGSTQTSSFTVLAKYYDRLKDALDNGEKGWIEMETPHGGRGVFNLEWITDIFDVTDAYKEEREAWDHEDAKANKAKEREIDLQ